MRVSWEGSDQGQRDGVSGRGGLLQGQQRHRQCGQRGERSPQHQVGCGDVSGGDVSGGGGLEVVYNIGYFLQTFPS